MLTHPNHVTVAADQQCCLLPTEWGAWKAQDSQLSWQAPTFGNQDHFGFSSFKRILLNIISGPHGQMFAVCRKFWKHDFLFQNRTTVLPFIQPQNHNAHGMDMLAFDWLWSYLPQSYMCWTDITKLPVLQEAGEIWETCMLEEGAEEKKKGRRTVAFPLCKFHYCFTQQQWNRKHSSCKITHIALFQSNSLSQTFKRGRVKFATGASCRDFTISVKISWFSANFEGLPCLWCAPGAKT